MVRYSTRKTKSVILKVSNSRIAIMPTLMELYIEYHRKQEKLANAYKILEKKEEPVHEYLQSERELFKQLTLLKLGLVPAEEKLKKLKDEKPNMDEKQSKEIAEIDERISIAKEKISEIERVNS